MASAKELLPIGSVVLVKEANKRMMIIGLLQVSDGQTFDYMAVLYPEGYLSDEQLYLFNHEDIEELNFVGYIDSEHQLFRNELEELLNEEDEEDDEDAEDESPEDETED